MLVNLRNCLISACSAALFAGTAIYNLIRADLLAAVIFALLCLPFAYIALRYGSAVQVDREGVRLSLLGRQIRFLPWSEVKEVGVVGTKIFHAPMRKKRYGTEYIYFSPMRMTDDDCFQMCLKWPPRDKIYCQYSFARVSRVQTFWSNTIHIYNADNVEI